MAAAFKIGCDQHESFYTVAMRILILHVASIIMPPYCSVLQQNVLEMEQDDLVIIAMLYA